MKMLVKALLAVFLLSIPAAVQSAESWAWTIGCNLGSDPGVTPVDSGTNPTFYRQGVVSLDVEMVTGDFRPDAVYAKDKESTCEFTDTSASPGTTVPATFSYTFDWQDTTKQTACGWTITTGANQITYAIEVIVREQADVLTETDRLYQLSCVYNINALDTDNANDNETDSNVVKVDLFTSTASPTKAVNVAPGSDAGYTPIVVLTVTDSSDTQTNTVTIGDLIKLKAQLTNPSDLFLGIHVSACQAEPMPLNPLSFAARPLLTSDCGTDFRLTTSEGFRPTSSVLALTPTFKAFKFVDQSLVRFSCTINFCSDNSDAYCTSNHCSGDTKRKRRSAAHGPEPVLVTSDVWVMQVGESHPNNMPLLNHGTKVFGSNNNDGTHEPICDPRSTWFLAVAIFFSLLLMVSWILSLFLCLRHRHRGRDEMIPVDKYPGHSRISVSSSASTQHFARK